MGVGNSIGKRLVLTTFGESHGVAVGGVIDGFPANVEIDTTFIQSELDRRKSGTEFFESSRKEEDTIEIVSGIYNGRSTGAPIGFLVRNRDQRPADYDHLADVYRPSHADFTWDKKFGFRDPRGGGRSSARETVSRVAGGAFAKILLRHHGIAVEAAIEQIGPFKVSKDTSNSSARLKAQLSPEILKFLEELKLNGDTTGGIISCTVNGVPAGLGEPVFDKLQADLARAMLSINSVKGFEYGSGFAGASMKGSEHNDVFINKSGNIVTATNHSGGIQGGISNGMEIFFRVAFKPVSTLMMDQQSVTTSGEPVKISGKGRHDVCVVPRALPVVEAMAALVIADQLLQSAEVGRKP